MNYGMWYCRAQLYSHIHNPYASVDELAASGIVLQNSSFLSLSFISNFLRAEWRFGPLDIWTHYILSLSFSQLLRMTANTNTHRLTDASPQDLWAIFRPFLFSTPINEILFHRFVPTRLPLLFLHKWRSKQLILVHILSALLGCCSLCMCVRLINVLSLCLTGLVPFLIHPISPCAWLDCYSYLLPNCSCENRKKMTFALISSPYP